jgi:outer membrane protein assembly factor BamA
MKKSKKIKSLEQKIAAGRQQLQEAYDARGYTDSTVLSYSIKLDKLINRYQKMTMMKKM